MHPPQHPKGTFSLTASVSWFKKSSKSSSERDCWISLIVMLHDALISHGPFAIVGFQVVDEKEQKPPEINALFAQYSFPFKEKRSIPVQRFGYAPSYERNFT